MAIQKTSTFVGFSSVCQLVICQNSMVQVFPFGWNEVKKLVPLKNILYLCTVKNGYMAETYISKKAAFLVRCSTDKQDYERQIEDLQRVADRFDFTVSEDNIFGENITGKDDTTKKDRLSIIKLRWKSRACLTPEGKQRCPFAPKFDWPSAAK